VPVERLELEDTRMNKKQIHHSRERP